MNIQETRFVRILFISIIIIRLAPVLLIHLGTTKGYLPGTDSDPVFYMYGAREMLKTGINPIGWFSPLEFSYIAVFLFVAGGKVIAPVFATALTGCLTVAGIYLMARALFDRKAAATAAAIAGLYPSFIFYGVQLYPETLASCFIVFSFFMLTRYLEVYRYAYLLSGGILWGLASQTRGGLHLFALFVFFVIAVKKDAQGRRAFIKPAAGFLASVYLTIFVIGWAVAPFQGAVPLNSKSGIGAIAYGLNRKINACTDYGNVRGNLAYSIYRCKEAWPAGSGPDPRELAGRGIWDVFKVAAVFIKDAPRIYIKNGIERLSFLWTPNQSIIAFMKRYYYAAPGWVELGCLAVSLIYGSVFCGGLVGIWLSRDRFRPIFICFIAFYCAMIFFSTGNSKLRFPMMPFFILYCAGFVSMLAAGKVSLQRILKSRPALLILSLFVFNSVYRYREILLTPAEINVRKVELCNELGFPKTALDLFDKFEPYPHYTRKQQQRLLAAAQSARHRQNPDPAPSK